MPDPSSKAMLRMLLSLCRGLLLVVIAASGHPSLAQQPEIRIEIDRAGTLVWNAPSNGADRYRLMISSNVNAWGETPLAAHFYPSSAINGRFSFAPPGLLTNRERVQLFRVEGEGFQGDTCNGAQILPLLLSATHTTAGYSNEVTSYNRSDLLNLAGPDRFYLSQIPGRHYLDITIQPEPGFNPAVAVFPPVDCGAPLITAFNGTNGAAAGGIEQLRILNTNNTESTMLDLMFALDSETGPGGLYAIQTEIRNQFPGDQPGIAEFLTPPAITNGTLAAYRADGIPSICSGNTGKDRFYLFDLATTGRVSFTVTPTSTLDPILEAYVVESLSITSITPLFCTDMAIGGGAESAVLSNTGSTSRLILMRVREFANSASSAYSLNLAALGVPAGDYRSTPIPVSGSALLSGGMDGYVNESTGQLYAPDRFYSVSVPAGQRVAAIVYPTNMIGFLQIETAPSPAVPTGSVLVTSNPAYTSNYPKSAAWLNTSPTSVPVQIRISHPGIPANSRYGLDLRVGPTPVGDAPSDPVLLGVTGSRAESTLGLINHSTTYDAVSGTFAGNDLYFIASAPPGERFIVHTTNANFPPRIILLDAEEASMGTLRLLSGAGSAPESGPAFWDNSTTGAVQIMIAIDALSTSDGGTFTLITTNAPVNPGETPWNPEPLNGSTSVQYTTLGYFNDLNRYQSGALPSTDPAPDRFQQVVVPSGERVSILLTPTNRAATLSLIEPSAPDSTIGSALARSESYQTNFIHSLFWLNPAPTARTVVIAVDGKESRDTGLYRLDVQVGPVEAGDRPDTPLTLAGTSTVNAATHGFADDIALSLGLYSLAGPDRFYRIDIPAQQQLLATLSNLTFDASLVLLDAQAWAVGVTQLLATANQSFASTGTETLIYFNTTTGLVEALLCIDSPGQPGFYTLSVSVTPLTPGDKPSNAILLSGSMTVTGTTVGLANDASSYPGGGISNTPAPDCFYRVTVPSGERVSATLVPSNFNGCVVLLDAASLDPSNLVVLAAADGTTTFPNPDSTGWLNTNGASQDVLIALDAFTLLAAGGYVLDVRVGTARPGELMTNPEPIVGTNINISSTLGFMNDASDYQRTNTFPGMDRYFSTVVPANTRLHFTLLTNTYFDGIIALLDGPSASSNRVQALRVAHRMANPAFSESATWANAYTSAWPVVAAVDANLPSAAGDFRFSIRTTALLTGDVPENAFVLTNGMSITNTQALYFNDYESYGTGLLERVDLPDVFHRVTVPAGERILAHVGPDFGRGMDFSIALLDAAPTGFMSYAVLSYVDVSTASNELEFTGWENRTETNRDVFVVVDSDGPFSTAGVYRLSVVTGPRPPGDLPSTAETVTASFVASGTLVGYMNDASQYADYTQRNGADRFYRATLQTGEQIHVTLTTTNLEATLSLVDPAGVESTNGAFHYYANSAGSNGVERLSMRNSSTGALEVLIAVEPFRYRDAGPFILSAEIRYEPEGDSLPQAQFLTSNVVLTGWTTGYVNEAVTYDLFTAINGFDRFYTFIIPHGERVLCRVLPSDFDPTLFLVEGPFTSPVTNFTPLATSRRSTLTNGVENIGIGNTSGGDRQIYLIVESESVPGNYTLDFAIGPGPSGDSPYVPSEIVGSVSTGAVSLSNIVNDVVFYGSLTNRFDGRDAFYTLTLGPGERVFSTATPSNFNLSVLLIQTNNAGSTNWNVLSWSDLSTSTTGPESAGWRNPSASPAELILAIDGVPDSSTLSGYALNIAVSLPPVGEHAGQPEIATNGIYTSSTTNYLSDLETYHASTNRYPGRDRYYAVSVPAGQRITAVLAHTNFNAALLLIDSNLQAVIEADASTGTTGSEFAGWINTNATAEIVLIAVESRALLAGGNFSLIIEVGAEPAGERPQTAELRLPPVNIPISTSNYIDDLRSYPGLARLPARDRFQRVDVPPGDRLYATLTPTNFNAALVILPGDPALPVEVLESSDLTVSSGGRETAGWANNSSLTSTVVIAIEGIGVNTGGTCTLDLVFDTPPLGDTRQIPQLVSPVVLTNNPSFLRNDTSLYRTSLSSAIMSGPDWFGQVSVPPGEMAVFTLRPLSGYNGSLIVMTEGGRSSTHASTLAIVDALTSTAAVEVALWTNTTAATTNLIIGVDSVATNTGLYAIEIFTGTLLPGETAENAVTLTAAGSSLDSTKGYRSDFNSTNFCGLTDAAGADRFYRIAVPPGQQLTASVERRGDSSDPLIHLFRESDLPSGDPACLDADDSGFTSSINTARYLNSGLVAEVIIIGIDSWFDNESSYRLTTILGPP